MFNDYLRENEEEPEPDLPPPALPAFPPPAFAGEAGGGEAGNRSAKAKPKAKPPKPVPKTAPKPTAPLPPAPRFLCIVSSNGLAIAEDDLRAMLTTDQLRKLRAQLTSRYFKRLGAEIVGKEERRHYRVEQLRGEDGKYSSYFLFARWAPVFDGLLEFVPRARWTLKCIIPPGLAVAWELTAPAAEALFPNQHLILDHLLAKIYTKENRRNGLAGAILVADTGFGKTFTGAALAARLGRKTLVVMPNTNNMEEWAKVFQQRYLVRVGFYYGQRKQDGDVVLTTIQSLTAASTLAEGFRFKERGLVPASTFFREIGLVIYDEIHNYATSVRHEVFWFLNPRCVLGLTATPDERADQLDVVYHYHAGPEVVAAALPGYVVNEIAWKGVVRVIRYHGPPQYTEHIVNARGWADTLKMNQRCARDPFRTALILYYLEQMLVRNRNVFVFAEHLGYLDRLERFLRTNFDILYPERGITRLTGGLSPDQVAEGRTGTLILITYGYGAESLSLPRMDALVLASPRRRKTRQILGRILRRGGDASVERFIYDFVDVEISVASQHADRRRVFEEKGFRIKDIELWYHDYEELAARYGTFGEEDLQEDAFGVPPLSSFSSSKAGGSGEKLEDNEKEERAEQSGR